jgi:MoaA/NifB/PqqE/SkfB family radical SAM enzyme
MAKEIVCKLAQMGLTAHMGGHVAPCNLINNYHLRRDEDNELIILRDHSFEDAWDNKMRHALLDQHKQGIWPEGCKQCQVNEEAGAKSMRTMTNAALEGVEPMEDQPRVLVLKHGNKCNNACRSCHPSTSAQWYKDSYKLKDIKVPFKEWIKRYESAETSFDEHNDELRRVLSNWNPGLVFIDLYGGEPLLNPLTYEIINQSVETGVCKNQIIGIHTNLTIFDETLVDKLSKFSKAILGVSFDAIGEKNDYIRHLSKWDVVECNLEKYIAQARVHPNIQTDFSITTQILNVFYLPEIIDYIDKKGWVDWGNDGFTTFTFSNRVYDKKECNIHYLPEPIKEVVKEKLLSYKPDPGTAVGHMWYRDLGDIIPTLETHPDNYDQWKDHFWKINQKLDGYRKQSFQKVMPEYYELFADYYSKV